MLRAIALDDEPMPLEILQHYADQMPDTLQLLEVFTSVLEAKAFLDREEVDLVLLDIQMPMLSGIDFYVLFGKGRLLIFTTAFRDFALEGFNLNAVDYLLKPFDFDRFRSAVEKAELIHLGRESVINREASLRVRTGNSWVKLDTRQILYIEAMGDYLRIHSHTGRPVVTRMTMKAMAEQLDENFLRIHKSYIVRIDQLTTIASRYVEIGNIHLPVGETFGPIRLRGKEL